MLINNSVLTPKVWPEEGDANWPQLLKQQPQKKTKKSSVKTFEMKINGKAVHCTAAKKMIGQVKKF